MPEPGFSVTGAEIVPYAAVSTFLFKVQIRNDVEGILAWRNREKTWLTQTREVAKKTWWK